MVDRRSHSRRYGGVLRQPLPNRLYSTSAQVLVRPNDPDEQLGSSSTAVSDVNNEVAADRFVKAQANVAGGPLVRAAAAQKLDNESVAELERMPL